MSNTYSQKNDESTLASDIVNACLTNDASTSIKNELDPYGSAQISRISNYEHTHVEGQQVMSLDAHNWADAESLQQPDLADSVYSNADAMMKQYTGPVSNNSTNLQISGRIMNDRERLQLHNQLSWEEASNKDVIMVRCRDMTAELYKGRLGSGSKGKCIKMGEAWMTPSEFEALAGRGSSKDWKRSIRFGGHTLQKLIEEGILAPHAIACTCSICCGESHLTGGPVRLFTPYKRKRKDGSDAENLRLKMDHLLGGGVPAFAQVEEIVNAMVAASQQLKLMLDQLRLQYDAYRDASVNQLRIQMELEKREALTAQRGDIVSALRRVMPVDQETLINQILSQMPIEPQYSKVTSTGYQIQQVCASCGREAYHECTACRRAYYCSTNCQQRDWPHHQHHCSLLQNSESMVASSTIQAQVDDANDHSQATREDHVNEN